MVTQDNLFKDNFNLVNENINLLVTQDNLYNNYFNSLNNEVNTLNSYFENGLLNLSHFPKTTTPTYGVLTSDSLNVEYKLIDSNYVNNINSEKINYNSNIDMGQNVITSDATPLQNNVLINKGYADSLSEVLQTQIDEIENELQNIPTSEYVNARTYDITNLKYNSGNTNFAELINSVPNNSQITLSPNNVSYILSNDYTISQGQIKIYGYNTGDIGGNNNVFLNSSNTLTLASSIRIYMNNISFNCPVVVSTGAICIFTNCTFGSSLTFNNMSGYVGLNLCSMSSQVTINNNILGNVFFFNCNFKDATISNNLISPNSSQVIHVASQNLPNLISSYGTIYSNVCTTTTDSRLYTISNGFYNSLTGNKYLYVDADISNSANISQSKINGLSTIQSDVNTLKGYFTSNKLNLTNLNSGSVSGQVLVSNGSSLAPSYSNVIAPSSGALIFNAPLGTTSFFNAGSVAGYSNSSGAYVCGDASKSTLYQCRLYGGGLFINTPVIGGDTANSGGRTLINSSGNPYEVRIADTEGSPSTGPVYIGNPTGNISLDGQVNFKNQRRITNMADPTANQDATTKKYVDDQNTSQTSSIINSYQTYVQQETLNDISPVGTNTTYLLSPNVKWTTGVASPRFGILSNVGNGAGTGTPGATSSFCWDPNGLPIWYTNCTIAACRWINENNQNITLSNTSGTISVSSSLEYKSSLKNKSNEYIKNVDKPIKNYYKKIAEDLNVYTYVYKKRNIDGSYSDNLTNEINQGFIWEEVYDMFNNLTDHQTLSDGKKPKEYYDNSNPEKEKHLYPSNMIFYIIMAMQEMDKFIIKPMQNKINELENKHNNLLSLLEQKNII